MAEPYNFDTQPVPEYFEFIVGGHRYRMRYPTTEELEKALDMQGKALVDYQYSFIEAVEKESPAIADNLKAKSIVFRNRLNAAIAKEFQREE
jgi:hypothetical protein